MLSSEVISSFFFALVLPRVIVSARVDDCHKKHFHFEMQEIVSVFNIKRSSIADPV